MHNIRALCYPYMAMAWRHRWRSIMLAWSICILGWGAIMLIPNKYKVSARFYVDSDAVLTPLLKGNWTGKCSREPDSTSYTARC